MFLSVVNIDLLAFLSPRAKVRKVTEGRSQSVGKSSLRGVTLGSGQDFVEEVVYFW